ncbi:FliH/SctL family protein [Pararhodospirillum oryzae]|uniref:Flagellar assembly protein FliH n=1 Tax=Pararhodospirillum oryzae TaxID=478448 RepID=A0A512H7Q7_9PROT|nr:FliH/SctL family protein [Pararhodospirillum oryzae]GEO81471.1 flagellar assembly protein FliH [Pararhodospirillum oryzae]
MGEIAKFLFDRRFDRPLDPREGWGAERAPEAPPDPPPEPEEPPPPPPPLFTAAEVDAAREEGYIAGHTAALEDASAANERMAALALGEVAQGLQDVMNQHAEAMENMARDAARLAYCICRKVLPVGADTVVVDEVAALLADTLPQVLDEPRLVVRVHPDVAELVRARVGPLVKDCGYEGRLTVTSDPRLGRPDCRVEWGEGGIERDSARQWSEIEAIVARHVGMERTESEAPDPSSSEPPPAEDDPRSDSGA